MTGAGASGASAGAGVGAAGAGAAAAALRSCCAAFDAMSGGTMSGGLISGTEPILVRWCSGVGWLRSPGIAGKSPIEALRLMSPTMASVETSTSVKCLIATFVDLPSAAIR